MFIDFIERMRVCVKERETEKEKIKTLIRPNQESNLHPRYVP